MYLRYFGLREKPFNATPDPRFFYTNRVYEEAYATLLYGIQERKGFIVLTGEVGTGKTTLLRRLMDNMNPAMRVVFFYNTTLTFDEMVEFICDELALAVNGQGRVRQLRALNQFLIDEAKRGATVVLLLDEAQNLSAEVLENLRLISNLETASEKLLQIALVGQPELQLKLADPALRQVTQRIAIRHRLRRLSDAEVGPFIEHRLRTAGRERQDLFTADAIRRIISYSNGIPRLINILCDNALLLAYASDAKQVTPAMLDEVAADLGLKPREAPAKPAATAAPAVHRPERGRAGPPVARRSERRRLARAAIVGGSVLVGLAVAGFVAPGDIWLQLPSFHWSEHRLPTDALPPAEGVGAASPVDHGRASGSVTAAVPATPAPVTLPESGAARASAAVVPAEAERHQPEAPALTTGPAASSEPDEGEPVAATGGRRFIVPRGGTISEIASDYYGGYSALTLDLIKEMNPGIRDIDIVGAGQSLWLPALTLDSLLRHQADGSYRLIVTSRSNILAAGDLVQAIRRHGYSVTVTSKDVASSQRLHRVEIEDLKTREAAVSAWKTARRLGWSDLKRGAPAGE